MKLFFRFFLLYFFSLLLLPCNETDAAVPEGIYTAANVSENKGDVPHDHTGECPPLCSCNCCNHAVVRGFEAPVETRQAFVPQVFASHYHGLMADMNYPIWQPPQLN